MVSSDVGSGGWYRVSTVESSHVHAAIHSVTVIIGGAAALSDKESISDDSVKST